MNVTIMITWLGFFSALFLSYYFYLTYRNKERMLLIEKNVDISELFKKPQRHFPWFMVGFTILGLGLGLLVSFGMVNGMQQFMRIDEDLATLLIFASSLLFAAVGIIIGHSIEQKKKSSRG